ncbi:MAG: SH3 domain-containing protein, partial [SAR202 cluster bacterium]|nr:SH3 domain-containing protein [SAR202 cluster bacterium]
MKVIFFISFFFILTTSICSAEETSLKMDEFLLDKIKSLEKLQEDVDLLFAEYCHFNNYEDSRCREGENTSGDQNDGNDTENYENGETYYTIKNANLRSEPKIATNILITVPKGESVQAYARSKDDHEWYKVKYDSTPGYMHESLLSKNKPFIQPKEEIPSEDIEKFEDITQSD